VQGALEDSGIALSVGRSTSTNSSRSTIEFRQGTDKFTVKCQAIPVTRCANAWRQFTGWIRVESSPR
jgi:hypothetical protein